GIPGGTFTISGGTHPIGSFCWTPGYNDVDLLPKTFTVTVKDDNCPTNGQQTFSFSIFVPSPFFTFVTTDVTCAGGNNGSATASPVYGNLYNYSWNSVPVQNTPTASGLAAGSYTLTVSDTNSCSLSVPVVISEPSAINISSTVADVTCFGENNGLIDITVSGGSGPYTFLWSNNSISEDISNLEPGNYQVEVTDGSGCIMIEAFTISEPDPLTASFVSTSPSCYGSANGSINLSVVGGTMPYSFTWSDGSVNEDLSGLVSGTYSVSIIDAVQCELVTGIALTQPDSMSISFTASNAACSATGGIAEAFVTGG
ncbi:MAG TPA: SprB repeat-containing protein, partial [Bacteroidia bacterium]|nr:SprB repeat-containing protein [Bacteroidia bacterium]